MVAQEEDAEQEDAEQVDKEDEEDEEDEDEDDEASKPEDAEDNGADEAAVEVVDDAPLAAVAANFLFVAPPMVLEGGPPPLPFCDWPCPNRVAPAPAAT